jgi:predicted site-specific integrase-resolvase
MSNEISIAEAARVADVSTQTIRNWIAAGALTVTKKRTHGMRGRTGIMAVDFDELRELLKRMGLSK